MRKLLFIGFLCACGSTPVQPQSDAGPDTAPPPPPPPAAELGKGDHSPGSVNFTVIADGLAGPRDLAFNPLRPDELWIVNHDDETTVIVHDASTDGRTAEKRKDGYALHFMAKPASIDFGADATTIGKPGTFGTCGESRNTYDDTKSPNDFMGPVLWSSDLSVFAKLNPNGLGSHLDMLHLSSNCLGIAHEDANVFWAISGQRKAVTRYDFMKDNGVGNDNHSDGMAWQYATGQVGYKPGVSSHLFWSSDESKLYVADAGNGRVIRIDSSTATQGNKMSTPEPMGLAVMMNGATVDEIIAPGVLTTPSGLEIRKQMIYVSDNDTSRITAFSMDGQKQLNWIDTGLDAGSLSGMAFGQDDKLYFVDTKGGQVLRIDPK